MIRTFCIAYLLLAVASVLQAAPPNIVVFFVDDMGWQDTSVPFHEEVTVWNQIYRTPHMQRLADQGLKLTNAYSASPVCSPTRASIMTGMNPARTHVTDWVRPDGRESNGNRHIRPAPWRQPGLQPGDGFQTLPHLLREAGYYTIHVGKAHFGARDHAGGHDPTQLGFDINIAGSAEGLPRSGYFSPWVNHPGLFPGLDDEPEGRYLTTVLTEKSIEAVDDALARNKPFFLYLSHYAVHTPLPGQGDPAFLDNYGDDIPAVERDYAAMTESMDQSLGDILDALHERGVADNTLVIFLSDNGGLSNHTRANLPDEDGPWKRDMHNTPLRSGKGSAYEGGIRVPMIVAWAGQKPDGAPLRASLAIRPGSVTHEPVITDDLLPTLLAVAGVKNPVPAERLDGVNLVPLFGGDSIERPRALVWHYPHQWYRDIGVGPGIEPFSALRHGDWKILYFYGDGYVDGGADDPRWELYNLRQDIGETRNLVAEHPDVAAELARMLLERLKEMDAMTPVSKATGEMIPMPLYRAADEPVSVRIEHPGGLHTESQLRMVRQHATAGREPWTSAFRQLMVLAESHLAHEPAAPQRFHVPFFYVDSRGHREAKTIMERDTAAAYHLALAYQLHPQMSKRRAYADRAVTILMDWTRCREWGDEDTDLAASYVGHRLVAAAELLLDYDGWAGDDRHTFRQWVAEVFRQSTRIKQRRNNWGDWGLLNSMVVAHFLDDAKTLTEDVQLLRHRIERTIELDGRMPHELERGERSLWYTYFALGPMTEAAAVAHNVSGIDYFDPATSTGKKLLAAFALMYPALEDVRAWVSVSPVRQVSSPRPTGWGGNLAEAMSDFYPGRRFDRYTVNHRPILMARPHHHCWTHATLFRETWGIRHP